MRHKSPGLRMALQPADGARDMDKSKLVATAWLSAQMLLLGEYCAQWHRGNTKVILRSKWKLRRNLYQECSEVQGKLLQNLLL